MYLISNVAADVAKKVRTVTMHGRYMERLAKWHELGRFGKALGILYAPVEVMLRSCYGNMSILESNLLYDLFSQVEFTGDFLRHLMCHPGLYMRDQIC
jgi:hypothetical protein